ncbi:SCO2522 family protein [Yinghuangia sp. YIM S09857]|uniref:SCO2522 family protein n=1 Tax=Yinghuangia sp. YIM S09857 TaxID=3436929 RepID=UPI003F52F482
MSVLPETATVSRTEAVPLSHASIGLGRLSAAEFEDGPERLREHFALVAGHLAGLRERVAAGVARGRPRISTCVVVDDYFGRFSSPAEFVPMLLTQAQACGLRVDYLARGSVCARVDGHRLAESVLARLVQAPADSCDVDRPPVGRTGWLSGGGVFPDVRVFEDTADGRRWSGPFLASVWQLLRLGLLRDHSGAVPVRPRPCDPDLPADWDDLPPLVQLRPGADPFAAYQTWTVLPPRSLAVEHAVQLIVGDFVAEPDALTQVMARAAREHLDLEPESARRIAYVFDPDL